MHPRRRVPRAPGRTTSWALRHIVSLIHPGNEQSIRVAEKLGEKLEGHHSTRGFDLLVYGTDLPLRIHRADGRVPSAHDDDRRDA